MFEHENLVKHSANKTFAILPYLFHKIFLAHRRIDIQSAGSRVVVRVAEPHLINSLQCFSNSLCSNCSHSPEFALHCTRMSAPSSDDVLLTKFVKSIE